MYDVHMGITESSLRNEPNLRRIDPARHGIAPKTTARAVLQGGRALTTSRDPANESWYRDERHGAEFLSPRDIAEVTGLHVAVIRRAIERGEIRAHKLCSRIRVRRTEFESWLERSLVRDEPRT
jgi:excisionase family DNA binding protein